MKPQYFFCHSTRDDGQQQLLQQQHRSRASARAAAALCVYKYMPATKYVVQQYNTGHIRYTVEVLGCETTQRQTIKSREKNAHEWCPPWLRACPQLPRMKNFYRKPLAVNATVLPRDTYIRSISCSTQKKTKKTLDGIRPNEPACIFEIRHMTNSNSCGSNNIGIEQQQQQRQRHSVCINTCQARHITRRTTSHIGYIRSSE